mmetsp:Transcript_131703/g.328421  ORF Transcript_131703/g.328421 Transcript_131703/m.328421 type:complete len:221 (+) Transcript_131703:642-1304(+)
MEPTTEEMLMILPQRFLVIPFSTALVTRNTELRFVLMTASQASSFMRIINVSFVMPALLTKMSTPPYSPSMALSTAATLSGSTTSSFMPVPFKSPPKRAAMASAPLSDVAVPTTVAPAFAKRSAMAAPMPREAPVTNATLPVKSKSTVAERAMDDSMPRRATAGNRNPAANAEEVPSACAATWEADKLTAAPGPREAKVRPPLHTAAIPKVASKACCLLG